MRRILLCGLAIILIGAAFTRKASAEGEAVNGYPNWSERVMLEWVNRGRADPQADLAACPSGQCLESACYSSAAPPRYQSYNLDHSSRFHADHMRLNDYFNHPSECTLRTNIASLYPSSCAGSASCSCTQGVLTTDQSTWTDPFTRMGYFGASIGSGGASEIIAAGYSGPNQTYYAWLYEQAVSSACGDHENAQGQGNGHRYIILTTDSVGAQAGAGYVSGGGTYGTYQVMDFSGTASDTYKIPSGSHYPQQAASVDAWANWYASAGPSVRKINVDGVCTDMALQRGTLLNGAWHATVSGVGSGCHRYNFAFKDSAGNQVLYPTSGSLAIGNGTGTCPDYSAAAPTPCAGFTGGAVLPEFPQRILDTRAGYATSDGQFSGVGALGSQGSLNLTVLGRGNVPSSSVAAVALNVTAVNPSAAGFITAFATGTTRPNASNLNFVPGQTIPNLVIAQTGTNGQLALFNSAGSTDLIADVAWYFPTSSQLTALTPARLLDTRSGFTTVDGQFAGSGPLAGQGQINLTVAGRGGIPASGVAAVIMNVTATGPTASGYVTVWPTGQNRPLASNLNFIAGQTIPNLVLSKVSAAGQVSLFNSAGSTHLIADATAWFPTSSGLTALTPARLLDTRAGGQTVDGQFAAGGAMGSAGQIDLTVLGRGAVPNSGVGAVVLNVTAITPSGAGYITAWPTGDARPTASNLNLTPGLTIANLVIAQVGSGGKVSLFNSNGQTNLAADVVGWFPAVP